MTTTRTLEWKVSGMDCSGCKLNIERVISKMNGVARGEVNYVAAKLEVEFDEETLQAKEIEEAVEKLGFGIEPIGSAHAESETTEQIAFKAQSDSAFREQFVRIFQHKNSRQLIVATTLFSIGFLWEHLTGNSNPAVWPLLTLAAGFPVLKKAFYGIKSGLYLSIEFLMSLAVLGSLFIGAAQEAAMVVVLFLLGEWLEGYAAGRARKSIGQLLDLAPQKAWKVTGAKVELVSASTLNIGDTVEVKPGSRVPTDGQVISGESQVDESLITGEATPIFKSAGAPVTAGSLNFEGLLRFSVTSKVENNSLAQVAALIEKAEGSKAKTERFIEKFSRVYTPFVVLVALAVAILPPIFAPTELFSTWIYRALGVLLIGCPCALVISVPASISAAIARGARLGILVKSGAALETLANAKSICFDKTGTVTLGKPKVCRVISTEGWKEFDVVSLSASVAQGSEHPMAKSLLKHARESGIELLPLSEAATQSGMGMSGVVGQQLVKVVSSRSAVSILGRQLASLCNPSELEKEESLGRSVSFVLMQISNDWQVVGWLSFEDQLKEDAPAAIANLRKMGFDPMLLTGDHEAAAAHISKALGMNGRAKLLPAEKFEAIRTLAKNEGPVVMVGDGINDAPALAVADVGVAFASGTEVAAERSDVVLMGEKLGRVVDLICLSRNAKAIVTQNILFAVGIKAVFLLTTIFGYTGLWMAVLSDTGATVLVTLNALRILSWKSAAT